MKKVIAGVFLACSVFLVFPAHAEDFTKEELTCLARNIYQEARNQTTPGKYAVGLVTLNRVKDERFPDSVCKVVRQANKKEGVIIINKCAFSWYCDGKPDVMEEDEARYVAFSIAYTLLTEPVVDITGGATHYHAVYVKPYWRKTKKFTAQIEDHVFYKWENKKKNDRS